MYNDIDCNQMELEMHEPDPWKEVKTLSLTIAVFIVLALFAVLVWS